MQTKDRFGNLVRNIEDWEKRAYLPEVKKLLIGEFITTLVAALISNFMVLYFIQKVDAPQPIKIFVIALFGVFPALLVISSLIKLIRASAGNIGVLHIYSEDIDFSAGDSKRPSRYIKGHDAATGKVICYSITAKEYETFRTHFGHLREIDYVVVNAKRIKYKKYSYFFKLKNSGVPIMESAVYDNIDKSVNNLPDNGMLSVRRR